MILRAYEAGEGTLEELAEDFGVSYGYTKKIRQQQRQSGQMERRRRRYAARSPIDEGRREKIAEWVREQPDLTLVELQEKLQQECRLKISVPPIWRALKKLGLRLKKNSIRRSRTNLGCKKRGLPSNSKSVGSTPSN